MPDLLDLLDLPNKVLAFVRGVKEVGRENADRMADLFSKISDTLAAAAAEIREGRVPHAACGELHGFADAFFDATRSALGQEKARQLANLLKENYNIRTVAVRLEAADSAGRDMAAQQLEESSGRFRASGYVIKAKA